MTTPSDKLTGFNKAFGGNGIYDLFANGEGMWWPFRSVAKALLQTQKNTEAYLEANRRLFDEMRTIVRKEQDLIAELSEGVLKELNTATRSGNRQIAPATHELNTMFDRAATGIRELSEAWIDAQVRSLDIMRSYSDTRKDTEQRNPQSDSQAA